MRQLMMSEGDSRIALVTGANRGIGLEICRQLAARQIRVILTSRDEEKGLTAVEALNKDGLDIFYHRLDVADAESVESAAEFVDAQFGRLSILVNNAAVLLDRRVPILESDIDTIRKTMETNVYGPLRLSQKLIPLMIREGHGRIVNVSSGMGQLAGMGSGYPGYRLSKTCLNAITLILASELKAKNILVNAMSPGWVRTDMGGSAAPRSVKKGAETAVWLATLPDDGPRGGFFRDKKPIPW